MAQDSLTSPSMPGDLQVPTHSLVQADKSLPLPGAFTVTPETFKDVSTRGKSKTGPSSKTLKSPDVLQAETTRQQKATHFSWRFFLRNCKESEAGSWGTEKIQRFMFKSFPALTGEKADGVAKLFSFLICTLYSSKGERTCLDLLPPFQKLPKLCQWLNTKPPYF